jgi:ribosomal protein S18 acetylase RimI-like enzyme
MAEFTFDASLGANGPSSANLGASWETSRAWPSPQIRTATLADLDLLTEVLASSFYDRTGWLAWLYPLIKLGIQEDLKQRLKTHQAHYACLAVVDSTVPPAPDQAEGDSLFPYPGQPPTPIVGTVEISLRQSWPWQATSPRYAYISNLAVAQTHRRLGWAAQLLATCETLAHTWQLDHLYLHVMEDNLGAQRLYRRCGFQVFQTEETLSTWFGFQPRRLLLHKALTPAAKVGTP